METASWWESATVRSKGFRRVEEKKADHHARERPEGFRVSQLLQNMRTSLHAPDLEPLPEFVGHASPCLFHVYMMAGTISTSFHIRDMIMGNWLQQQ